MRDTSCNISPADTKHAYAESSAKRNHHKQAVYNVSLPFTKKSSVDHSWEDGSLQQIKIGEKSTGVSV